MNEVSIALITDDNYVVPTIVTIASLLKSKKFRSQYDIYVLGHHLTPQNKSLLEKQGATVIECEPKLPKCSAANAHVSVAALLKFDLTNIFKKLDKILYLDTDMVILRDLSAFFNMDLGSHYAAVVKDMAGIKLEDCAGQIGHKNYFNSGMMLLNLKKMRADKISEKLLDYKLHKDRGHFMDQDCLNAVFRENVIYVSPVYNWMAPNQMRFDKKEIRKFYHLSKDLSLKNAVVVHLTNKQKAWDYADVWGHKLWKKYYKKSVLKHTKRCYQNEKKLFGWEKSIDTEIFRFMGVPLAKIQHAATKEKTYILGVRVKLKKRK
ncbi:MAG: glycosyltransferase family 8 protein [Alphaproteobacteria bacterium]|nr:glycosyltransferase family 8 protein [Alphaproteobacteria bacterium]